MNKRPENEKPGVLGTLVCGFSVVKNPPANAGGVGSIPGSDSWVRKIPWRRARQPTPAFLPGKSHGQRSLAGFSLWCGTESDTTEHMRTHPHLQSI